MGSAATIATPGGLAPEVVAAAVHLVETTQHRGFNKALGACLEYAGPNNFAPVIAGAWLGALHGGHAVDDDWIEQNKMLWPTIQYKRADVRPLIRNMADRLAQGWGEQ